MTLNQILIDSDPGAEAHARRLLEAALALGADPDFERSAKFSAHGVNYNRFLIGVAGHLLEFAQLEQLCRALDLPEALEAQILARFDAPSSLLLGFEQGAGELRYKLYFEFWDHVVAQIRGAGRREAPILLDAGFKWDVGRPENRVVTEYVCHPLLDANQIVSRVRALLAPCAAGVSDACCAIVLKAAQRQARPTFVYMVAEEENGRRSFDLNLYSGELELGHIDEEVGSIRDAFGLPPAAVEALQPYRYKAFGHLSAGIDRAGQPFVTLYFEDELPA